MRRPLWLMSSWHKAALRVGEELTQGPRPPNYDTLTPKQWLKWALAHLARREAP